MCQLARVYAHLRMYMYIYIHIHVYSNVCVCVCMYSYVYACIQRYVRINICIDLFKIFAYMCIYTHIYMYVSIFTDKHVHAYTYQHVLMSTQETHKHICMPMICTHLYMHTNINIYTHRCVCKYTQSVNIYEYRYTPIYINQICIHTYTHTLTQALLKDKGVIMYWQNTHRDMRRYIYIRTHKIHKIHIYTDAQTTQMNTGRHMYMYIKCMQAYIHTPLKHKGVMRGGQHACRRVCEGTCQPHQQCNYLVLLWDAVCCSVMQCVAVCCSVLQCVAVRCSVCHLHQQGNYLVLLWNVSVFV